MAIYLDSHDRSDALRTAREFFMDFDRVVANQRIFDLVKHGANRHPVPVSPASRDISPSKPAAA